jgi:hypothetical protein
LLNGIPFHSKEVVMKKLIIFLAFATGHALVKTKEEDDHFNKACKEQEHLVKEIERLRDEAFLLQGKSATPNQESLIEIGLGSTLLIMLQHILRAPIKKGDGTAVTEQTSPQRRLLGLGTIAVIGATATAVALFRAIMNLVTTWRTETANHERIDQLRRRYYELAPVIEFIGYGGTKLNTTEAQPWLNSWVSHYYTSPGYPKAVHNLCTKASQIQHTLQPPRANSTEPQTKEQVKPVIREDIL